MASTSCISLRFVIPCLIFNIIETSSGIIESVHVEYAVDYISDVKIDNLPRRRGPYLRFLTRFVSFDIPEWLLLGQVDDCQLLIVNFFGQRQMEYFL